MFLVRTSGKAGVMTLGFGPWIRRGRLAEFGRWSWRSVQQMHAMLEKTRGQSLSYEDVIRAAFESLLGRSPDQASVAHFLNALKSWGYSISQMLSYINSSTEARARQLVELLPKIDLPDLTVTTPNRYRWEDSVCIYRAESMEDFDRFESLIIKHRFYDAFNGIVLPTMDVSKKVTAAIIAGLGAHSCLELGCFNGLVVGLLRAAGISATGIDASHLAFALADARVRNHMLFGDLLELEIPGPFAVIAGMDVYEHLNPAKFPRYVKRTAELLSKDGYVVLSSPMFGPDDVFGELMPKYVRSWAESPVSEFWLDVHCTDKGWPMHGHLVWQSPQWWEAQFCSEGLVRDREIERAIHGNLEWFYQIAPYRRFLFVLKHVGNISSPKDRIAVLTKKLSALEKKR